MLGPAFLEDLYDVECEASFEAKEADESRNGIGRRWCVVDGRRRSVQGSRWSGSRYSDAETGNNSR
jgi:hypothetical protein